MFAPRYFAIRYFPGRYWPPSVSVGQSVTSTINFVGDVTVIKIDNTFAEPVYADFNDVEDYLDGNFISDVWIDATTEQKKKVLIMATRAMDRLNYMGEKAESTQYLQFPRADDTSFPQEIINACVELALTFLEGTEPENEYQNTRIALIKYNGAKTTSDKSARAHINSGIPNKIAWNYLLPFLRPYDQFDLARTN